jgi:hypothetical protein
MRWHRGCLVLPVVISAAGCFYYQPLETAAPQPGTYIEVVLTDSGTSHFWGYLGPDVANLRGRLVTANPQTLALSVQSVEQRHGQVLGWKGETVTLGREYVATMQERHLSTGRTVLLAGGTVVGFVAMISAVANLAAGSGGSGGGGPPR